MNDRTYKTLELAEFLELAAGFVQTPLGRDRMQGLRPSVSLSEILHDLELTGECREFLSRNSRFGLSGLENPSSPMEHLKIEGTSLEPKQILEFEKILLAGRRLKTALKESEPEDAFPHLRRIAGAIPDTKHLLKAIEGKILPNGEIDDNASAELRLIRRELTERRFRIHRTLESLMRASPQAVQEEIVTFRNDRYVIPVRTDSRGQIPGVVHGLSSSGQTTYIEPLTVIDQNNDLVRLHEKETTEIAAILFDISELLRGSIDEIAAVIETLTVLDVSQAKALLADEFDCVQPHLDTAASLSVQDVRNILLESELRKSGLKSVPISLHLSDAERALIISGPNAGGKTVTLKTLGLLSLMAQMGFMVPAREVALPVFRQIFADIGDQQSMVANLSTFTAHMRNIAEMDDQLRPPALVLLDEAGTGTDPDEGAALAIAVIDHFRSAGATVIASTHYPRLKMWASQSEGVRNASVEFDEETLQPTYRLILGAAGSSSGIEIARRMRIREEILRKAQSLVDPSYAQVRLYLRQLKETLDQQEIERQALFSERAEISERTAEMEADFEKRRQEMRQELHLELEKIVEEFRIESERSAHKIRDRVEAVRLKKAIAGETGALRRKSVRLNEELFAGHGRVPAETDPPDATIVPGDRVRILSLDREGTVESIADNGFVVVMGALRYRASRSDLLKARSVEAAEAPSRSIHAEFTEGPEEAMESELNVIGMNADEALASVDKFLDRCYLSGADTVRIVHGHGKGILRRAIAGMLEGHLQVDGFQPAPPEQGGNGATIVALKK